MVDRNYNRSHAVHLPSDPECCNVTEKESTESVNNGMKKVVTVLLALIILTAIGCGSIGNENEETALNAEDGINADNDLLTVGFSQLGAESDWRSANTDSMLEAFSEENGFSLIYKNGQQKQANQITAIRTFVQQEVDYIVLAPVTETGWWHSAI